MTFLTSFQEMKRIYGLCPCCGEPFRLSDVSLYTRSAPPKTAFDELEIDQKRLQNAWERFDNVEDRLRQKARELGQKAAGRRLRRLLPFFTQRKLNPQDVKVLFHPVEYVAFCGMNGGQCRSIDFIDRPADSARREAIQKSLDESIRKARMEWQTYRVSPDGALTMDEKGGVSRRGLT